MCAHAASPTPNLTLDGIRARLRGQYRLHRRGALFWTAYQSMQLELVRDHPRDHVRLCNAMADIAEDLGVVEHAQLIGNRNAVSTLR